MTNLKNTYVDNGQSKPTSEEVIGLAFCEWFQWEFERPPDVASMAVQLHYKTFRAGIEYERRIKNSASWPPDENIPNR